jgi:hypothetical protein
MSVESWPQLNPSFGSEVIGFWRCLDVPSPRAKAMTITWYESLAVWEGSRGKEAQERSEDLVRHLMRRQKLVISSLALAMQLVPLDGSKAQEMPFA